MKVAELMSREVQTISPGSTIREAARMMCDCDIGAVPVAENDRLVGMVTDRDIAVRAVCEGKGPDTPVREVMTQDVKYCFEDEAVTHVARNMGEVQVRRLPVVNRDKRLVGIIAIGDVAKQSGTRKLAGESLAGISRQDSGSAAH